MEASLGSGWGKSGPSEGPVGSRNAIRVPYSSTCSCTANKLLDPESTVYFHHIE